jgi:hypothetical protein
MTETQTPEQQAVAQYNETADPAWKLAEQDEQPARAFYRSDWRKMAQVLKSYRHVRGDIYTAKPEAQQDSVSALVVTIAQIFEADSQAGPGETFDAGKFIDGTQLPAKPHYDSIELPEDDEDAEDDAE